MAPWLRRAARISDFVALHAAERPEGEAAWDQKRALSYAELLAEIESTARGLLARGVRRGDRVAMHCGPSVDFWVMFLAAASIGAVWMGLSPRHRRDEIAYVLDDAQPALIVLAQPECADAVWAQDVSPERLIAYRNGAD
jgi:fatty-acyl-CoA synthase